MNVEERQSYNSQSRRRSCCLFPHWLSFLIFSRIVVVWALTFVLLVGSFGGFYFFIVFFEHFIGEVELVIDGIFPDIIRIEFIFHLLVHWLCIWIGSIKITALLLSLFFVLIAFSRIWEDLVADLHLLEYLVGHWIWGEIGMVLFDELEIGSLELLLSEVVGEIEKFEVVGLCGEVGAWNEVSDKFLHNYL